MEDQIHISRDRILQIIFDDLWNGEPKEILFHKSH